MNESQNAFVRQNVKWIASDGVDHQQPMHFATIQVFDSNHQRVTRSNTDKRAVSLTQHLYNQ